MGVASSSLWVWLITTTGCGLCVRGCGQRWAWRESDGCCLGRLKLLDGFTKVVGGVERSLRVC